MKHISRSSGAKMNEEEENLRCKTNRWVSICWLAIAVVVAITFVIVILCGRKDLSLNAVPSNVGGIGDGFCFDGSMSVWVKDAIKQNEDEKQVIAKDVEENDFVRTIDLMGRNLSSANFIWTRAASVDIFWGDWKTHNLTSKFGDHFKIKSPHLMMILKKGIWCVVRSDTVKAVDEMKVGILISRVAALFLYNHPANIAREVCTMQVNKVLGYNFCHHSLETTRLVLMANMMLNEYQASRCGDHYDKASHNFIPWRRSYQRY